MKSIQKCMALFLSVILITQCISSVSAQEAYTTHSGTLLDASLILEGEENVTINEDGSWTVTGDFVLSCPLSFDYRISTYSLVFSAFASGTFDFEIDLVSAYTQNQSIPLSDTLFYRSFGSDSSNSFETYISLYFDDYADILKPDNYRFQATILKYRAITAQTVVFKELSIEHPLPPGTPGNVNLDATINTVDARLMLLGISSGNSGHLRNVDVDENDCFDTRDVRALLTIILSGEEV